jgi:hypothetical protein
MIRDEIRQFCDLGPLPACERVDQFMLKTIEEKLLKIMPPISDGEARLLVSQFGPDECYGLAWTLLHLIETAPSWPIEDCLRVTGKKWVKLLRDRAYGTQRPPAR